MGTWLICCQYWDDSSWLQVGHGHLALDMVAAQEKSQYRRN